jgi:hypothetical protein
LLNNIPKKISTVKEKQVTPNENTHLVTQLIAETVIDSTSVQMPIPRVQNDISSKLIIIPPLTARVLNKSKEDISPKQLNIRHRIREVARARLPHRHNMQLRQQEQRERVQMVQDNETGEYLNYQQLIRNPKHKEIWSKSAANEFGRLAQGVGGRVKQPTQSYYQQKPSSKR